MGSGSWSSVKFASYTASTRGVSLDSTGAIASNLSNQEMFKSRSIDPALNPHNVIRECCDSEEHPNTKPVILALDVTGSMGDAAVEVAKKLNVIMTKLYKEIPDIEFMIMGIGDLAYDSAPIQASQFESDIRIAEQLDKVWFEFGGGGNSYESYSAAWYFGLHNTRLDCWNRGEKGIIITIGDEMINPYLPQDGLSASLGNYIQGDIDTHELYKDAIDKFDIYHLDVNHRSSRFDVNEIYYGWNEILGDHFIKSTMNSISDDIINVILNSSKNKPINSPVNSKGEISW